MNENKQQVRFCLQNEGNTFGDDGIYSTEIELQTIPVAGTEICLGEEQQQQLAQAIENLPDDAQRQQNYRNYWRDGRFHADLTTTRVNRIRCFPSMNYWYVELSLVNQGAAKQSKPRLLAEESAGQSSNKSSNSGNRGR